MRLYEVITNNSSDDENVAAGAEARAMGLPGNGYPHDADPAAVVVDIQAENHSETPYIWHVTLQYSTDIPFDLAAESQTIDPVTGESLPTLTAPPSGGGPPEVQRDSNPINWTTVYRFTHEQTQETVTHDRLGDPLVNSAGDPLFPAPVIERSYPVITVVKNYIKVQTSWLDTFMDTVNLDPWMGRPGRTCRMVGIDTDPDTVNNFPFWRVTFRIKVKPGEAWDEGEDDDGQGWDYRYLDQGFRERLGGVGVQPTPITPEPNQYGDRPAGPYALDGTGIYMPLGTPKYRTREIYRRRDWSTLGI
jgi:hypothetical protein